MSHTHHRHREGAHTARLVLNKTILVAKFTSKLTLTISLVKLAVHVPPTTQEALTHKEVSSGKEEIGDTQRITERER